MTAIRSASDPAPSRLRNVSGALLMRAWMHEAQAGPGLLGERSQGGEASNTLPGRPGTSGAAPTAPGQIAELLDRLFVETFIVGGDAATAATAMPGTRIPEVDGPACALRGLVAAFEAATSDRVLVVADDLAYLNADLLLALTAWPESDAVVPVDERGEQPLCAIYRREACLAIGRQRLDANHLMLDDWLDGLQTARVPLSLLGFGPEDRGLPSRVGAHEASAKSEAR